MDQERLDRINALARKAKSVGLTEEETAEQKALRREYLRDFRETLRGQIENITIVEPDGSLTPVKSLRKKK
ncbi:MAG: DUF896 domain-containing protein [Eubacteriales bacterium]|nr:DUF896 domain-containing protein [Eubacteriales bacterium]